MAAEKTRVVVTIDPAGGGSQVHHHDFPEIRSRGSSPADGATQLLNHLSRALDTALTQWRREAIERAIADVKAFAEDPPADATH